MRRSLPSTRRHQADLAFPADGLAQSELAIINLLTERKRLQLLLEQREARATELQATWAIRDALITACRDAGDDAAALRAISAQRQRVRTLTAQLDALEEEQDALLSSGQCADVLKARLRVEALTERHLALSERLRHPSGPSSHALHAAHGGSKGAGFQAAQVAQAAAAAAAAAAAGQLERATTLEGWLSVRALVEELMDRSEEARRAITAFEREHDAQVAVQAATRAAAAAATNARAAPLRAELARLRSQSESLQRSLSDEARRKLEAGAKLQKQEQRLRGDLVDLQSDVQRLLEEKAALSSQIRIAQAAHEARAVPKTAPPNRPPLAALAPAKASAMAPGTGLAIASVVAPSWTSPETPAASVAAPVAAKEAAPVSAQAPAPAKPKPPAVLLPVLSTEGSKVPTAARLDDEQRKRLEALRAKYGGNVADKAAARAQGGS